MSKGGAGYGTSYVRQRVGKGKHSHQETRDVQPRVFETSHLIGSELSFSSMLTDGLR
jgi:hypothetical protein